MYQTSIVTLSGLQEVDLVPFYFSLSLLFSVPIYFPIFLFLELRVRVNYVTQEEKHRRY